ncbi:MAG: gliding motility-associated C-terminal domain-containing protein [Ferruginibacter sp.]
MRQSVLILLLITLVSQLFCQTAPPVFKWARVNGGPGNENISYSITTDPISNIYSTGSFEGTIDFDPGPAVFNLTAGSLNYDIFVSKTDSSGNFIWARQFKGSSLYGGKAYAVCLDNSNNVYVTGTFQNTVDFDPGTGVFNLTAGSTVGDIFVAKLDAAGNFIWAKQFKGTSSLGSFGKSLAVNNTGDVIVTGVFSGTVDFDPGAGINNLNAFGFGDIFVACLNSNGDLIWVKQIGGSSSDECRDSKIDGAGNIILTGNFQSVADFDPGPGVYNLTSASSNGDAFICKLSSSGNLTWVKSTTAYESNCIAIDSNNNVITAGNFGGTADFDPGPAIYNLSAPNSGVFVLKLNTNGDFVHAGAMILQPTGPNYAFKLNDLNTDAAGNIYTAGYFIGIADFDPGPGTFLISSQYYSLPYVCKLTPSVEYVWVVAQQTSYYGSNQAMCLDAGRNIYASGIFGSTITFNAPLNPLTFNAIGGQTIYLYKMGQCNTATYSLITASACNSYTLNGHIYVASGVYTQIINNTAGCDSVITLNLTLNATVSNVAVTACNSFSWQGNTYFSSGIYSDTLMGAGGCDSILNLNLTINHSTASTISAAICEGQQYAGHTVAGVYTDTYTAANGCDSVRTLYLAVNTKSYSAVTASICQGQYYYGHNATGVYNDTLRAANGCDSIRTLYLTVNPIKANSVNVSICQGETYFAGGTNQTITGIYKDTLQTSLGCDSIITTSLVVHPNPQPDLGPDRNLCVNAAATISPGSFNSYLWQDNSTGSGYTVNTKGKYWVTVTNAFNCRATDTLTVLKIDTFPVHFLPADKIICPGSSLQLSIPGYKSYLWSTGSTTANILLNGVGKYWLTVTDKNNCSGTDSIVLIRNMNCIPVSIPNAFTPNHDGLNDVFRPSITIDVAAYKLVIFNRYGEKIFETADLLKGWDGTYKGTDQPRNAYVYTITLKEMNGTVSDFKGTVTLVR